MLDLADRTLSSNYRPCCECPRSNVFNSVWKLGQEPFLRVCDWTDGRRELIEFRPANAAPLKVPLSIYGVFDLGLQQSYELANVIQAFHVQNDFFNLRLPPRVQNAISKH